MTNLSLDSYEARADRMAVVMGQWLSSIGVPLEIRRESWPQLLAELRILMLSSGLTVDDVLSTRLWDWE